MLQHAAMHHADQSGTELRLRLLSKPVTRLSQAYLDCMHKLCPLQNGFMNVHFFVV